MNEATPDPISLAMVEYEQATERGLSPQTAYDEVIARRPQVAAELAELLWKVDGIRVGETATPVTTQSAIGRSVPLIPEFSALELIGEGTFGSVYRGVDDRIGATVAIKVLRGETRLDAVERAARFRREMALLERFDLPGRGEVLSQRSFGRAAL